MTKEQHEAASKLLEQIEDLELTKAKMDRAVSDEFKPRNALINILGTSQEDGEAIIPKECFKLVCSIIRSQTEILLYEKNKN